jgi:hypothetical protein
MNIVYECMAQRTDRVLRRAVQVAGLPNRLNFRGKTSRRPAACCGIMTIAVVALSLLAAAQARAIQSVSLAWNSTADSSVAGYALYYGAASGHYSTRVDVGTNTTATVPGLIEGSTNYFALTAYNAAAVESPLSTEVSYLVPGLVVCKMIVAGGKTMQLRFPVASGHSYQVEASTNLTSWAVIWQSGTATSNAWTTFQDPLTKSRRQRFYRLVLN